MEYVEFIQSKSQWSGSGGFKPKIIHDWLFDFQSYLVEWAVKQGRGAIFADCGMGKTAMQLSWAQNVIEHTNKKVLIVTPLAVGLQTIAEAARFGIEVKRSRNGQVDTSSKLWVTNYEQLGKFDPAQFAGVVCDESSAIKDFKSVRKDVVVEFMRTCKYRLLCTATAAPNDFFELGTSSEALGLLGWRDMITKFFKQETSQGFQGWGRTKYRFRGHAEQPFWSWVCSWARSLQKPSDLGFNDGRFILPPLIENEYVVNTNKLRNGMLFSTPAFSLPEQREERRNSLPERCDKARELVESHDGPSVVWCELNAEGDRLASIIPNSVQIKGSMPDEQREELLIGFSTGKVQRLVTKPKIGAWGLNWQHCCNVVSLPSHSFEQYYQSVRRCYRFGQKNPVTVSLIVNEGEAGVLENLRRKAKQCQSMFASIVAHMQDSMHLVNSDFFPEPEELPNWLFSQ